MTKLLFECPPNWQTSHETKLVSISEVSLCEYKMVIHTALLCGHELFLPMLPRGKETISCVVEPNDENSEPVVAEPLVE